jgi:hypothetical protein
VAPLVVHLVRLLHQHVHLQGGGGGG